MRRFAAVALGLVVAAFPVWAQHGGGAHGGGFGGGHAGGFSGGHAAPAFHGGFSGGASRSFSGPAFRGGYGAQGRIAIPGSRPMARPFYGPPRYGIRTPYGSGIRYGARPPMAGANFRRVNPGAYRGMRNGFDRRGRRGPYISNWWPTYSYYYPWIGPGFPTILDCDNPHDNLGCGYGYGGYADNGYGNDAYQGGPDSGYDGNYGMLGEDQGNGDPNLGAWPSAPPQYQQPAGSQAYPQPGYGQPYAAAPSSEEAVTLIFKDGRPPQQIHNYVLTPTTLYAGDIAHRQMIPLDQLDIPATEKANLEAGVDFHVPQLEVRTVPNPGLPDTHVIDPQ